MKTDHLPISTPQAPGAIGPYVQGLRAGSLLFVSGQIGLDPATGELVKGGIKAETERVLKSLCAIVAAAGGRPTDIVKTTVYLAHIGDFAAMNEVYKSVLGAAPPARSTVGAAALPRGARVEIEAVAALPER
ncbi:MAG: RidA family protein [Planctomycetales bacterium]|nr:RidA family protein [Planctomycetales bacterium]